MDKEWYTIDDISNIDSPAFVIYEQRLKNNIDLALSFVSNNPLRLRPHVKTHKCLEVSKILINKGISKFKCATISEAEMLAMASAPDILLAYQPYGPKIMRLLNLVKKYSKSTFSCLIDNFNVAEKLSGIFEREGLSINVFIDINVGMNRTGIDPGNEAVQLYVKCKKLKGFKIKGLHAYDGHIRDTDFKAREMKCNAAFADVEILKKALMEKGLNHPIVIAGGSPSFPIHAKRDDVECSPGTFVFWDAGYEINLPEQHFEPAALVISRIISFPEENLICLDLGHKSIAAESSIDKRVRFINAPDFKFISQSEEHLVVQTENPSNYRIGQVLFGIPYHVCPTTALFEAAYIIRNGKCADTWKIIARDRKLTV